MTRLFQQIAQRFFLYFLVIRRHDYQPPRASPWKAYDQHVPYDETAAPDHDWNARILRYVQKPGITSRVLDGAGMVCSFVNTFAHTTFNVGPTLFEWIWVHHPKAAKAIVAADRQSLDANNGHGGASAQTFEHLIMTLAPLWVKKLNAHWGIEEFRFRFGRDPEEMWLPEAAVDLETLEVLAEQGIKFVTLRPGQAWRWRREGDPQWSDYGQIDPHRPYRINLPSGRTIWAFFYNEPLSQGISFKHMLRHAPGLAKAIACDLRWHRKSLKGCGYTTCLQEPKLVLLASDGELFGWHEKLGFMGLAKLIHMFRQSKLIRLTNLGNFLQHYIQQCEKLGLPIHEVELHRRSSWSCIHGDDRWWRACGCVEDAGSNEGFRGPLRHAFDWLAEKLDDLFENEGARVFKNPAEALYNYIYVILHRGSDEAWTEFFARYARPGLTGTELRQAQVLLEIMWDRIKMYTSCGWYFGNIRHETTNCMQHAARAVFQAARFGQDLQPGLLARLEAASDHRKGNGRVVFLEDVLPYAMQQEIESRLQELEQQPSVELIDQTISFVSTLSMLSGYVDKWDLQERLCQAFYATRHQWRGNEALKEAFYLLGEHFQLHRNVLWEYTVVQMDPTDMQDEEEPIDNSNERLHDAA
jgi:alpha-amylase/alpha-mannosidase (GH57 family)